MNATPYRSGAEPAPPTADIELDGGYALPPESPDYGQFDDASWEVTRDEQKRAGGRMVLGSALTLLAALWLAYTAWQAGRTLGGQPLSSPQIAQWIAVAAGPLALMGLVWLMFGRTRRKEAEQFTRSVVTMRTEAAALQDVLGALSAQINRNHDALGQMAGQLMNLGDEAASRLGGITADLHQGARTLADHGSALDRAAENARTDIGVLLADLPEAEQVALRMAEALRGAGSSARDQAASYGEQVDLLTQRTKEADATVHDAAQRLVAHLTHIESASAAATARVHETGAAGAETIDALLVRTSDALEHVRGGIDLQAGAVDALLAQASAGIGRAGIEASEALASRVNGANASLDGLSARIAEQERASQRLVSELDLGLAALDEKFGAFAANGDERSARIGASLGRLRSEISALGADTGAHDQAILAIADRTHALREGVTLLSEAISTELSGALVEAEAGAARLYSASSEAHPLILGARDAAVEAQTRIAAGAADLDAQQQQLSALLANVDGGVGQASARLAELGAMIGRANQDATALSNETGPALVAALVQVREAAAHAADRARSAIADVIPQSAGQLGEAARIALEKAVREAVSDHLAEVDRLATHAVTTARAASEQLTAQMLSIGQSASALEAHIERSRAAERKDDGENFARRVSLLMDSMHSASIDVGKILSDEIDDKAWSSYLKGNRDVFTRRAVRLIGGTESRALQSHYDRDPEFQESVNRYVADFESMLRRVLAERDGGMIAVTLMSSDMGKLYAALAQAIDRRR